jgi:hypothetical protein
MRLYMMVVGLLNFIVIFIFIYDIVAVVVVNIVMIFIL